MRGGIGDPLSPGWSGVEGGESLGLEDSEVLKRFPKIPSLPLSAEAAERIRIFISLLFEQFYYYLIFSTFYNLDLCLCFSF